MMRRVAERRPARTSTTSCSIAPKDDEPSGARRPRGLANRRPRLAATRATLRRAARLIGVLDDIASALGSSGDTYREVIAEMLTAAGYGIQRGFALHDTFLELVKEGVARGEVNAAARRPDAGRHHRRRLSRPRRTDGRHRELDCGQDVFARDRPSRPGCRAGRSVGRRLEWLTSYTCGPTTIAPASTTTWRAWRPSCCPMCPAQQQPESERRGIAGAVCRARSGRPPRNVGGHEARLPVTRITQYGIT